jgi:hypothetical protein
LCICGLKKVNVDAVDDRSIWQSDKKHITAVVDEVGLSEPFIETKNFIARPKGVIAQCPTK